MRLTSSAFDHTETIPAEYTCDGENVSPELHISDVPKGTKSLALVMEDPDTSGGILVHWVAWNIDPSTKIIPRNSGPENVCGIGICGVNDFRAMGYAGPCPPSGTHRYFFKVFALDITLDLPAKATKKDLEAAMDGHEIEHVELIGIYRREEE